MISSYEIEWLYESDIFFSLILNYLIFYTYHTLIIDLSKKIKFIKFGANLSLLLLTQISLNVQFEFYSF